MSARRLRQSASFLSMPRGPARVVLVLAAVALLGAGTGCASVRATSYEYLQTEIHPRPVRAAATAGELVGFLAGIPLTAIALPFTVPYVLLTDVEDPYRAVLYPSVTLSEFGATAFGGPLDAILPEDRAEPGPTVEKPPPKKPPRDDSDRRRGRVPAGRAPPARDG